jgi:hypothetical protein
MADSSPTPNVVTMADIPFIRAYPSAAYPDERKVRKRVDGRDC